MSRTNFYRIALLLPYVLPLIALLTWGQDLPDALAGVLFVGLFSMFFGFIPYSLLVIGLWLWSLRKEENAVRKLFLLSPLMLALLMWMPYTVFGADSVTDFLLMWAFLGLLSVAIGYLYISLAGLLFLPLRTLHLLK